MGAGIVGAACAVALAEDGWRVTILDRSFASAGTTSVGMGHSSRWTIRRTARARRPTRVGLWWALGRSSTSGRRSIACGTLWVAEDAAQLDAVRAKRHVYAAAGITTELLDEHASLDAEPSLAARFGGSAAGSGRQRRVSAGSDAASGRTRGCARSDASRGRGSA